MVLELYPIKKVTFCHFSVVVERESGTVTSMHLCLSALAESSSGKCGTFVCYCWMMLRVDGCLNEDPGPLPGPRPQRQLYCGHCDIMTNVL